MRKKALIYHLRAMRMSNPGMQSAISCKLILILNTSIHTWLVRARKSQIQANWQLCSLIAANQIILQRVIQLPHYTVQCSCHFSEERTIPFSS